MLLLKRPCTQFLILISSARRIQEENISISRQALMYAREGMVTVHFLPESQYPGRYR